MQKYSEITDYSNKTSLQNYYMNIIRHNETTYVQKKPAQLASNRPSRLLTYYLYTVSTGSFMIEP